MPVLAKKRAGNTEADIVVAVVGLVVVAVGRAEVVGIVVPRTVAQDAGRRGRSGSGAPSKRGPEREAIDSSNGGLARTPRTGQAFGRDLHHKNPVRLRRTPWTATRSGSGTQVVKM
jgi:hypothetical protein